MTGILVVNEFLNTSKFQEIHKWLLNAAVKFHIDMKLMTNAKLLIDIMNQQKEERMADFILFWDKDVKLALYLEQLGYPVFNSSQAIRTCDDKALTHLALMKAKIPMPRTILSPMTFDNIGYTNYNFLEEVAGRLGFPMVVKECFGSFGQQVYLIQNFKDLQSRVIECGNKPILFQEFKQTSFGRDIRLQVVGEQVIAGMYRYNDDGDFRANISAGGKMKEYVPTKEQCDLAIRCCKEIGLSFAGVDLLFGDKEEPIICEINSNAHFKSIYDCTGVNAAEAIMKHITNILSLN